MGNQKEYKMSIAPLKRILIEGSKSETGITLQIGKDAALSFRNNIEHYANVIAKEIGEVTRADNRRTIKERDVIQGIINVNTRED
jgi:histone H3/H4